MRASNCSTSPVGAAVDEGVRDGATDRGLGAVIDGRALGSVGVMNDCWTDGAAVEHAAHTAAMHANHTVQRC